MNTVHIKDGNLILPLAAISDVSTLGELLLFLLPIEINRGYRFSPVGIDEPIVAMDITNPAHRRILAIFATKAAFPDNDREFEVHARNPAQYAMEFMTSGITKAGIYYSYYCDGDSTIAIILPGIDRIYVSRDAKNDYSWKVEDF